MITALQTQNNMNQFKSKDDLLDSSAEKKDKKQQANSELVQQLLNNLSGLANLDLSVLSGINMPHLVKATEHLKHAQNEFQMAQQQIKHSNFAGEKGNMMQPEILRLNQQSISVPGKPLPS